jgi:hypothetical protein
LTSYFGYTISHLPANLSAAETQAKENAWFAYAPFDHEVCQSVSSCTASAYANWWAREYVAARLQQPASGGASVADLSPTSGPTGTATQITASNFLPAHALTVTVGSQTATITSGTTTDSSGNATIAFTIPSGLAAGAQAVVVSDGTNTVTSPTNFTVTSGGGSQNVAPLATVTASSQTTSTGQTAAKAVDGSTDGYPGDYSREWATNGGKAGSWLNLAWASPQTLTSIVFYDRPNSNDQITAATITFSDGSTLTVPSLPNDGRALSLTFPAKTTTSLLLTITSVSSTTQNIGLAELQTFTAS